MKPIAESRHTMICIHVSCKYHLKQNVLFALVFIFALECAICRVQADEDGLKLIVTHQLVFYNDLNVFGASIHSVKENTETSVFFSNENGLEINYKKTKYIVMS